MMTVIAIASFLVITGFILLRIDVYRNVAKQRAAEKEAEEKAKKDLAEMRIKEVLEKISADSDSEK
jgi:CRISPR/Cas system-associated protein endoribonuclease Cas2